MNKNPDLPKGWAMPDNMARRVHEQLSKKRITPEDELKDTLDEIARDIAIIEPNPVDWAGWVLYLLDKMGLEAERRGKRLGCEEMLKTLLAELMKRSDSGKW